MALTVVDLNVSMNGIVEKEHQVCNMHTWQWNAVEMRNKMYLAFPKQSFALESHNVVWAEP